jgi:2-desacetyl-2-hydroxyethyl bacteriochlorophyllide A dehydrogenase
MKAGVYRGKERIEFEDVPDPEIGDHDILLRVSACGICGSDLHVYSAGWATDGMVLGHEYSGVVAAAGAKVTKHSVGDRLAVIPAVACRECLACKSGQTNLCEHPAGHAGGYAELVALSENVTAFRVPETTSMEAAAFLEPLSVAVRAVNRAALDPADAVVVVGLGSIGLSVLQVLRARGVAKLVAVDLSPRRLELASRFGADVVLNPLDGDVPSRVREVLGESSHRGYESSRARVVFECSGAGQVVGQAITELVTPGGTLVMVALFEQPVTIDPNPLVRKEVNVVGSYAYTEDDWKEAFRLLSEDRVDVLGTVTHRVPLAQVDEAFKMQLNKSDAVKVLITP